MILPRRHRVAPLLLTLLLSAGPLAAATYQHRPQEAWQSRLSVSGVFSEAWAFVSRIWGKEGSSTDPFGKAGSSTDPFGKAGSSTDPFGKAGSGIDPFGKAGGSIDPFGNPTPNTQPPSGSTSAASQPVSGH